MNNIKRYLPVALLIAFILFGLSAFFQSKPTQKNSRIYKIVQKYSPYYLDKRFGGLTIKNKDDDEFKERPNNMTLFKEFERLEMVWGKSHLSISNQQLIISDENEAKVLSVDINTEDELAFIHRYYGI